MFLLTSKLPEAQHCQPTVHPTANVKMNQNFVNNSQFFIQRHDSVDLKTPSNIYSFNRGTSILKSYSMTTNETNEVLV